MTAPANVHQDELALVDLAKEFMQEIKDLTPGKRLEAKLNKDYGPDSRFYRGVRGQIGDCRPLLMVWASLRSSHFVVWRT